LVQAGTWKKRRREKESSLVFGDADIERAD
jgi:hypothetical protein